MQQKKDVAIQTYKFREEIDFKNINNNCLSCGEDIKHPLCPNCISKGFMQWVQKFPESSQLRNTLNTFMRHHNSIKGKSKRCVSCGRDVHICPYCFTSYLYELVKEAGLGPRAMSEFLFMFNFDFKHRGYSKELETYGGY